MNDKPIALLPPPPRDVQSDHKKQVRLQIWLPVAVAVLIILALMVLVVLANGTGTPDIHVWGNVAAMYVIFPVLFVSLVLLAILGGLIFLLTKALKVMPRYMHLAQAYARLMASTVKLWGDRLANPVLLVRGVGAGWWAFKKEVRRGRAERRRAPGTQSARSQQAETLERKSNYA